MFHCYDKTSFLGLVERGNEKEVTALLQQGDVPRDELDRALQLAMLGSHRRIAQRLLERGADPFHGDREDRQALAYAAMGGDPELVSLCLSLGAEPNRVDQRNATALALAAGWGKTEAVQILCAAGADPEIAPSYGGTALIEASRTGNHPDTMAALLDAGANVHAVEPGQERTALYYAADRGHDLLVERLLIAGADPDVPDFTRTTPLMVAAAGGHAATVRVLLRYGADLHRHNIHAKTALSWAAGSLNPFNTVRVLVTAGADIHQIDGDGETPLSRACHGHSPETVRWLLENVRWVQPEEPNQRPCPLLNSLGHEYEEIQAALLAHPATKIDYRCGPTGGTALFWAAAQGKTASLHRLLEAGADPDIPDKDGLLPVQAAAQRWQWQSLELLAAYRVDLEPPNHALLFFAAAGTSGPSVHADYEGTVRWVIENVPLPSQVELDGGLVSAAGRGNVNVIKLLLQAGADVNAQVDGNSALANAIGFPGWDDRYQRPKSRKHDKMADTIALLLEAGADVNLPLRYGSLLGNAKLMRCRDVVRMLEACGARPRRKNR
jgi:ankyrin repeat protein